MASAPQMTRLHRQSPADGVAVAPEEALDGDHLQHSSMVLQQ